jgi:glutaredoxin
MTSNNLYTLKPNKIVMYSVDWCPDCRRAKSFFQINHVSVIEINVDNDEKGTAFVREINSGKRIVPTIIFPDGDILVEPSNTQLAKKLGL